MTTTVKTDIKSTLLRTAADFEPKLIVALGSGAAVQAAFLILAYYHVTVTQPVQDLATLVGVLIGGYLKASTHKGDLLAKLQTSGLKDAEALAPAIAAAIPAAAPIIATVEDIARVLTPEQTSLSAVTAGVTDPVPSDAAIAAAATLPAPVA